MKLSSESKIDLQKLVGALLISPHGAEFLITDFHVITGELDEIFVGIVDASRTEDHSPPVRWSAIKDWEIQLN